MEVDPSTDNPDNGVQGLPPVCVEVFPEKIPQPFQFDREAIFPTGKFQPPVSFARLSPVACETQKVKRSQTFSPLICLHRSHVTRRDKLRFVFVELKAKPTQSLRQYSIKALCLMLVLEGEYHIVRVPDHVCPSPDMRVADFSKPFIYHVVQVDVGKYW